MRVLSLLATGAVAQMPNGDACTPGGPPCCTCAAPPFTKDGNGDVILTPKQGSPGFGDTFKFPPGYGATCGAPDLDNPAPYDKHPECDGGSDDAEWCPDTWCYVADPCETSCVNAVTDQTQTMMYDDLLTGDDIAVFTYSWCAACSSRANRDDCSGHTSCKWQAGRCADVGPGFVKAKCGAKTTAGTCGEVPLDKSCKWEGGQCKARTFVEKFEAFGCGAWTPPAVPAMGSVQSIQVTVWNGVSFEDPEVGASVTLMQADGTDSETLVVPSSGSVTFNMAARTPTEGVIIKVSKDGFTTSTEDLPAWSDECQRNRCVNDGGFAVVEKNIFLSPAMDHACGAVRGILTWGKDPADLDSWLMGACGDKVYYSRKVCQEGYTHVSLDVDVTSGYGPETVSLHSLSEGTYQYKIHHYSGESNFRDGGAVLTVYFGEQEPVKCTPPAQCTNADIWTPFEVALKGDVLSMAEPASSEGACRGGCSQLLECTGAFQESGIGYTSIGAILALLLFAQ